MKTKKFLLSLLLTGSIFTLKAQNVASTSNLTSGGLNAGTSGTNNTYYGYYTGSQSTGSLNTFIGAYSGRYNMSGSGNTALGSYAGRYCIGTENVCIGANSGNNSSAQATTVSSRNTLIGYNTGYNNISGAGNIFIGYNAGYGSTGSNKLIIENTNNISNPLIWGDFAADQLKFNGKVTVGNGINTFPTVAGNVNVSSYNLFVKGGILTEEVRVNLLTNWADYVFEKNYNLLPLEDVEIFVNTNGHLPNVPSAKEVKENGIELGEISKIQQEKIEELTLYAIDQDKKIKNLNSKLEQQQQEIEDLKTMLKTIIDNNK